MELVINKCYGGFSLSMRAIQRLAELKGKKAYFFKGFRMDEYTPITNLDAQETFFSAYSVPNPKEYIANEKPWEEMTMDERIAHNRKWDEISLNSRPEDRADPDLIKVVRELGEKASGSCAKLEIIDIPDDIEWEIDEYDGIESVHEKRRSWG